MKGKGGVCIRATDHASTAQLRKDLGNDGQEEARRANNNASRLNMQVGGLVLIATRVRMQMQNLDKLPMANMS